MKWSHDNMARSFTCFVCFEVSYNCVGGEWLQIVKVDFLGVVKYNKYLYIILMLSTYRRGRTCFLCMPDYTLVLVCGM